ncbi:ribonucleotide reductase inhibitor-domain-containing protein, partial [Massariosphaeria phaeospora]
TTSEQHRHKRPFQPSIARFFARDAPNEVEAGLEWGSAPGPITRSHHYQQLERQRAAAPQRQSGVPSVPGHVQADLLSVGMRVRKSVPEGYKTHKRVALPSIQTTLSKAPTEYSVKLPGDVDPEDFQHERELLPFCGLHKIGGFAEQPVTNVHLYGGKDDNGVRPVNIFPLPAEAFIQPFSSQDSTATSFSAELILPNPANPQKRSWQDEDACRPKLSSTYLFALPKKFSDDDVPVSPLSATPPQSIPQAALRPFAQPKTRKAGLRVVEVEAGLFKELDMDMDAENAEQQSEGRVAVGSSSDFDDAEFL